MTINDENFSVPRTFRFEENPGHFWLAAYLVPAGWVALGALVWELERHGVWPWHAVPSAWLVGTTIALATSSAIGLGLVSLFRGESKSYYAYQPLISAWVFLLLLSVWAVTLRG